MVSDKKRKANRRNAQFSSGPVDTSQTRLNALRHGILSNQVLVDAGHGSEDAKTFEELSNNLRDALAPVGALEELLAEQLISSAWRLRRVIGYESAVIGQKSEDAIWDWE